jgi:hypothetical protein
VRSDGRWVVPYKAPGSQVIKVAIPRREPIRTGAQALEWAAGKVLQQRLDGSLKRRPVRTDGPTISDLGEKWLKLREPDNELAGSTVDNNRTHFQLHIRHPWGTCRSGSSRASTVTRDSNRHHPRRRDSTVTENGRSGVAVRKNPEGRPWWGERQRSPHFLRQLDGT